MCWFNHVRLQLAPLSLSCLRSWWNTQPATGTSI